MDFYLSKLTLEEKKRLYNMLCDDLPSPESSAEQESESESEPEPEPVPVPVPVPKAKVKPKPNTKQEVSKKAPVRKIKPEIIEDSEEDEEEEIEDIELEPEPVVKTKAVSAPKRGQIRGTKFVRMKNEGKFEQIKIDRLNGANYNFLINKYGCSIALIKKILAAE